MDKYQIETAHARLFARTIYRDISTYIQSHQKEFQEFLQQEKREGEQSNGDKTSHRQ